MYIESQAFFKDLHQPHICLCDVEISLQHSYRLHTVTDIHGFPAFSQVERCPAGFTRIKYFSVLQLWSSYRGVTCVLYSKLPKLQPPKMLKRSDIFPLQEQTTAFSTIVFLLP